ncbi:MAG: HNH endonuclease [Candidatus Aminicenantes bacterium]|nr:HNH endonuclease [Candidatus Aminicenantes bacterium]
MKSKKVEDTKKQIENMIKAGINLKSADFEPHWHDIKEYLWQWHDGKCCYCERKRDKREFDVEHFRPKAGISDENGHPGYWWLAYEWENLFLACKSCNQEIKKTQFPLLGGSKRAFTGEDDLKLEKPVLINPVDEDPEKFIGFVWQEVNENLVIAVGLDKEGRGHKTAFELTAINKEEVKEERTGLIDRFQTIVGTIILAKYTNNQELKNEFLNKIKEDTRANKRFAGFRRAYFRAAGFGEYVSKD